MRVTYLLLLGLLICACGRTPAPPDMAHDLNGWAELYRRPGWSGGPAVDLRAVGDIMLARYVAEAAARNGYGYPFAEAAALLAGDLAIGNLESPLTERRDQLRPGPYRLPAPPAFAPALAAAGFEALALANNHGLDSGPAGLGETLAGLTAAGILPLGAGPDLASALRPALYESGKLRLALFAFNDVLDPEDDITRAALPDEQNWTAPDFAGCPHDQAPCGYGRAWLSAAALAAVRQAANDHDAVIVLVHWGVEYMPVPTVRQRDWAARLVAAGADLVLGSHPHILQPVTMLEAGGRSGFVAYSLGNFIFDGLPDRPDLNSGAVLRVLLDQAGVALVAAAPLDMQPARPRALALDNPEAETILQLLQPEQVALRPSTTPHTPLPDGSFSAWRWNGAGAEAIDLPGAIELPPPPERIAVDLRGDGKPLWAGRNSAGLVELRDGPAPDATLVWQNEAPGWQISRIAAGDPNDDGRNELLLLLWQVDEQGTLRSQPFLLGWRGGRYRIIWGGSPTSTAIQDLRITDFEGDGRSELLVLEGGNRPGDPGESVAVWRWHGWGFQLEWRSPPGQWSTIGLLDLDHDGRNEIIAGP